MKIKQLTFFGWISILRTRSVLSQSKKANPPTDLTPRRWPPNMSDVKINRLCKLWRSLIQVYSCMGEDPLIGFWKHGCQKWATVAIKSKWTASQIKILNTLRLQQSNTCRIFPLKLQIEIAGSILYYQSSILHLLFYILDSQSSILKRWFLILQSLMFHEVPLRSSLTVHTCTLWWHSELLREFGRFKQNTCYTYFLHQTQVWMTSFL